MKFKLLTILIVAGLTAGARNQAFGGDEADASGKHHFWHCLLNFEADGHGFKVIFGKYKIEGQGEIVCRNIHGETSTIPVEIKFGSSFFAPEVAFGKVKMRGLSSEIVFSDSLPEDLLGTYLVAHGSGSLVGGAGAFVGIHKAHHQLIVSVSMQALHGFGVDVGLSKMTLSARGSSQPSEPPSGNDSPENETDHL